MKSDQYVAAVQEVMLASNTKYRIPPSTSWLKLSVHSPKAAKKEDEEWVKSRSSYRLSFKNVCKSTSPTLQTMGYKKPKIFVPITSTYFVDGTSPEKLPESFWKVTATRLRPYRCVMSDATPTPAPSPEPAPFAKMDSRGRWTIHHGSRQGAVEMNLFPLSTLLVKWTLPFSLVPPRALTTTQLSSALSTKGQILSVVPLTVNSALAVYADLDSARRAVRSSSLGAPSWRLTGQWLYPALAQPNVLSALKGHRACWTEDWK